VTVLSGATTINPAATPSNIDCSFSDNGIDSYAGNAPLVRRIKSRSRTCKFAREGRSIIMAM